MAKNLAHRGKGRRRGIGGRRDERGGGKGMMTMDGIRRMVISSIWFWRALVSSGGSGGFFLSERETITDSVLQRRTAFVSVADEDGYKHHLILLVRYYNGNYYGTTNSNTTAELPTFILS